MRQETQTYTIYKFNELSESAKEKVIAGFYDINVNYDWWDHIYEEIERLGGEPQGFDTDRGSYVKIDIPNPIEFAQAIVKDHGETCETYKTAKAFLDAYAKITPEDEDGYETAESNDLKDDFRKSICEDYLILLRNEYEYLTSKEAIVESIEANGYEFLENGKRY